MKLKSKKIIAREILILSCLIISFLLIFVSIKLVNLNIESKKQDLIVNKQLYEKNLDSIAELPRNLNWNNIKYDKKGIPFPPKDILYAKNNSKDSSKIKILLKRIQIKKTEINNLTTLNSKKIIKYLSLIVLIIIYPIRCMFYVLKWSVKIMRLKKVE
jgi:hypothetical protein